MANLFLVDLSPSDLPRTLSELTGIQNLQNAAEALSKNARSFDRVIKEKNDKLQKLNADLENYAYVDKDLESIETIETKLLKINSEIESTNKARQFIIDNNKIVVEAKDLKKKIDLSSSIINLIPKFSKLEKLNEKLNLSKNYLKTYKVFANEFNSTKSEINKLKTFRSDSNLEKYNDLQGLISSNDEANNFLNLNDVNIKEQNSLIESIDQENNKIISYKKELKLLIEKLKVEGNWCDSCNRPLI